MKNKRSLELVTSCSSSYKTSCRNSFISYIWTDQFWWFNIKCFLSCSKSYISKFMQANSWHKLFHFYLSFWIWKVWKGRKKTTKTWISWEQKELFQWNKKNIFFYFWRTVIWWKNKNLIINSTQALRNYYLKEYYLYKNITFKRLKENLKPQLTWV